MGSGKIGSSIHGPSRKIQWSWEGGAGQRIIQIPNMRELEIDNKIRFSQSKKRGLRRDTTMLDIIGLCT